MKEQAAQARIKYTTWLVVAKCNVVMDPTQARRPFAGQTSPLLRHVVLLPYLTVLL